MSQTLTTFTRVGRGLLGALVTLGLGLGGAVALGTAAVAAGDVGAGGPAYSFRVTTTVNVRLEPTQYSRLMGRIPQGGSVNVYCWTMGQSFNGDPVWAQVLFNGAKRYVSDYYIDLGGRTMNHTSVPQCLGTGRGYSAPVKRTVSIYMTPSFQYPSGAHYPAGQAVTFAYYTYGPSVGGDRVWGVVQTEWGWGYIPDYYINLGGATLASKVSYRSFQDLNG